MFELWSDGSCHPNPGPGGFAFIIKRDGAFYAQGSGPIPEATNNIAELTAVIRGLDAIPPGSAVTLYCDSQYVVKGLNEWRHAWKRHGWLGIKNADLWAELDDLTGYFELRAEWIRGHSGVVENEECDRMAAAART